VPFEKNFLQFYFLGHRHEKSCSNYDFSKMSKIWTTLPMGGYSSPASLLRMQLRTCECGKRATLVSCQSAGNKLRKVHVRKMSGKKKVLRHLSDWGKDLTCWQNTKDETTVIEPKQPHNSCRHNGEWLQIFTLFILFNLMFLYVVLAYFLISLSLFTVSLRSHKFRLEGAQNGKILWR